MKRVVGQEDYQTAEHTCGTRKLRILFLCTHNSARSQMAEGLLRAIYGDIYEVYSAGTHPTRVHPLAVEVMREIGIDISRHRSKSAEEFGGQWFDIVATVCDHARETCPVFPNARYHLHCSFPDPSTQGTTPEEQLEAFRGVRDQIKCWIEKAFDPHNLLAQRWGTADWDRLLTFVKNRERWQR